MLVTISGKNVHNLGNILQHYALQETLRKLSFEVDSVRCPLRVLPGLSLSDKITGFIDRFIRKTTKLSLAIIGVKEYRLRLIMKIRDFKKSNKPSPEVIESRRKNYSERKKIFASFYEKYITGILESNYQEVLNSNKSRWEKYNYVVTGSDQVWSSGLVGSKAALQVYYLYFVERDKRVCYAPSFGVHTLINHYFTHKKGLKGFNKLSCREKSGCALIKKLTGQDAQLVLDPTLLLNADDWRKISRKPDYELPERYAVIYSYELPKEYRDIINNIAAAKNLEIIDVFDPDDKLHFLTGPQEFLYLVDHAEFVFTGSFHGTVFSINFEKNFISFGENDARIGSILSQLGLINRFCANINDIPSGEINYQEVNEKLNILRESSLKYLRDCLHV